MEDNRTVVEVDAPPEAPLPGSSWIGVALFPFFAVAGLALGLAYGMPWLITSSLAISLALLAVVGSTFVNRRGRAGVLRLDLHGDGVRIGPGPLARWLPITAGALALVAILVDIGLRIGGFFAEESGGLTFSLMIAAVIGWGLFDGYHGLTNPPGLLLTPRYLITIGSMGKQTPFEWATIGSAPSLVRGRIVIPVGRGDTQVGVNQIDSDPRLVLQLIEVYRKSPARRSELRDGRVADRARTLRIS